MKKHLIILLIVSSLFLLTACEGQKVGYEKSWAEIEKSGKQSIVMLCYDGDDSLSDWLEKSVAKKLKEDYEIDLRLTRLSSGDMLDYLLNCKKTDSRGEYDIIIFDNDKFSELKSNDVLYKDATLYIKNYRKYFSGKHLNLLDINGTSIDKMAVPISQSQLCFFYNDDMMTEIPENMEEFKAVLFANKGAFTYPHPSTELGRAFVSSVILEFVDDSKINRDGLTKDDIKKLITPAMVYLKEISPHLFGSGKYHPKNSRELDLLFKEGYIMMNISMSHLAAKNKVANDEYPDYPKPLNPLGSSVSEVTYAAIPYNSTNKSGAILTINTILSLDVQKRLYSNSNYEKLPCIDIEMLNKDEIKALNKEKPSKTVITPSKLLRTKKHKIRDDYWKIIEIEWEKIF